MREARGQLDVESGLHGRDEAERGVELGSREAASEVEEDEEGGCGGSSECEEEEQGDSDEGHPISEESVQSMSRAHYKTCHQSIACMSVCTLVAFFCQGSVRVARDARLWPRPQRANAHDASGSFVTDSQYLWLPLVISRIVGVVVFGHLGDTRGRRLAVSCALVVVGVSTLLMAFLPTEGPSHSAVGGLWALLTALQSMGVGGEWAGSIVIPYELCQNDDDRCIGPSIPYAAMPLGFGLGAEAVDALWRPSAALPQLPRLAFVLGGLAALGCGWWARKDGQEARIFRDLRDNGLLPVVPLFEVLWVYPLALVMGFLTLGVVYLIQNFVNRAWYFLLPPQLPSVPMLCLTLVVISVFTLLGSILACFVTGRRGLYMAMCLVIGLGVYPWIVGEPAQTSHYGPRDWVAVGVLAPVLGLAQGPIPSLLADMFDTSTLMTGLGLVFWGGHTLMNILWPLLLRLPDIEEQKLPQSSTPPSLPPSVFALLVCVVALVSAAAGCLTRCIDFGPPPRLTRSRSLHVRDCIGLSRPSSHASSPSLASEENGSETGQEENAGQVNEVLQRVARSLRSLTPVREDEEQTMAEGEEEGDEEAGAEEVKQAPRGGQHHSAVPREAARSGRGRRHRHRRRHRDMSYRLGAAGGGN